MNTDNHQHSRLKVYLFDVIFGVESPAGKLFDITLICMILASVAAVMIDSVSTYHDAYGQLLTRLEWFFTFAFTIEYILRIYVSPRPRAYIFSFYGIIDLLSILPTYLSFLLPGAGLLIVIRIMRVLRIFRILKLFRYIGEANILFRALLHARRKILVFLFSLLTMIVVFGTLMFIIEGPDNGFSSIPVSMYWAIVTVTTVGYGDIAPQTVFGQAIASLAMICGYAIIAIPTGIISVELMAEFQQRNASGNKSEIIICKACDSIGHDTDARHCKMCGEKL
jgi:voltage-gated potassium channel